MRKDFELVVEEGREAMAEGREEWRVVKGEEELQAKKGREGGR